MLEDIVQRFREWNAVMGDVQMFPFRPARMSVGDILIHRIVGLPECELVAIGGVTPAAQPSANDRWPESGLVLAGHPGVFTASAVAFVGLLRPWQVSRRLLFVSPA